MGLEVEEAEDIEVDSGLLVRLITNLSQNGYGRRHVSS